MQMLDIYEPLRDYTVLVRCMTYNHAPYIEEALNGFVLQKTSFPFVCIIMDDASTDGEQLVLDKWMQAECMMEEAKQVELNLSSVIIVPHRVNKNCTMAFYLLKKNLFRVGGKGKLFEPWRKHCQYEAICEGDDYWTDKCKLQRQVDFLDKNLQYSMIGENAMVINTILNSTYPFSNGQSRDISSKEELVVKLPFQTASVLMRMSPLIDLYRQRDDTFDRFIWCWMLTYGKIYFNNIISSVYRRGLQGVCEGTDDYQWGKQLENWNLELLQQFDINKRFIYFHIARFFRFVCHRAIKHNQYISASKSFFRMILYFAKYLFALK